MASLHRASDGCIDLVAVDRVVDNLAYAPLTVDERDVAAQRMAERGHGVRAIARILRCNTATIRAALTRDLGSTRAAVTLDLPRSPR